MITGIVPDRSDEITLVNKGKEIRFLRIAF